MKKFRILIDLSPGKIEDYHVQCSMEGDMIQATDALYMMLNHIWEKKELDMMVTITAAFTRLIAEQPTLGETVELAIKEFHKKCGQ